MRRGRPGHPATSLRIVALAALGALGALAACAGRAPPAAVDAPPPRVDHHQHLFGPGALSLNPSLERVDADALIALLDEADIGRAAVLSLAYQLGNPDREVADERARVRAENDWTAAQVMRHPERLRGFCGVNPLRQYAIDEIARCARMDGVRTGLKLHFGNSDVDVIGDHAQLCAVFAAANERGMVIVVHARPNFGRGRPYRREQAEAFLRLLECAPDVPVQVAHLGSAGNWNDPSIDAVIDTWSRAIAAHDPRVANVWFDVSGVAGLGDWADHRDRIARHLRAVGIDRLLFGADGTPTLLRPRDAWTEFRRLPLTAEEFTRIAANTAPWMQ